MIIELTYRLSYDEFKRAFVFHYSKIKNYKLNILFSIALIVFCSICWFALGYSVMWLLCIILSVVSLSLNVYVYAFLPKRLYKREPRISKEVTMKVDEEGFDSFSEGIQSKIKWDFYSSAKENNEFIMLYFGKDSFTIIPKRAFKEKNDYLSFKELMHKYLQKVEQK